MLRASGLTLVLRVIGCVLFGSVPDFCSTAYCPKTGHKSDQQSILYAYASACVCIYIYGQRFYFYAAPRFFLCWLACGFFLYAGAVFFLCWGGPFLMLGAPPCATSRFFLCCRVFFFMLHGASSYSARFWGP